MVKKYCLLIFVILFASNYAQQNDSIMVLTLQNAIDRALQNNWDIHLADKDISKAEEQINEAYSNAFPRLDLTANYTRNIKLPVLFIPPNNALNPTNQTQTFEMGSKNSVSAGVSFSQVIYNQKVNTAIKIAGDYSQLTKFGKVATINDVKHNIKTTFYTILLLKQLVIVTEQSYNVANEAFKNISAMYKQGVTSEYDYLRSQVQVSNIEPSLIQSKNNLEMALNGLKNLLGIDVNKKIDITGSFAFEELPLDTLQEESTNALENNAYLRQLTIQESLLNKNIDIEKSEYYPSLSLFSAYQWQTQDNTFKFKEWNWANSLLVGVQLNYTLFDGFKRGARIQQAKIEKEKVGISIEKLQEGIKIQVLQARLKMEEAKKKIFAQTKSVEQAEKALKIAQTRFKSGVGTQLELIDTQVALTIAQTNYAQATYDYLIARSDWEYAVSKN